MLLLVSTLKPATDPGWTSFFRIKIVETSNAKSWERIDGQWNPFGTGGQSGAWRYDAGKLRLITDPEEAGLIVLRNLHWNFRIICNQRDLTGPGESALGERMIWVLGPGLPRPKPRTIFRGTR